MANLQPTGQKKEQKKLIRVIAVLIGLALLLAGGVHLFNNLSYRQDYNRMVEQTDGALGDKDKSGKEGGASQ